MAQTLLEDCSYSLITEQETDKKRQVYFVKLTDSCLKAIEEHTNVLRRSPQSAKTIIRFDDCRNGVISIPQSKSPSTPQDTTEKKFNFGIANVVTSENNPLQECIKQCNWNLQLISYGPLEQKISIAATDDCYENTRNRMAQVDQERKDVRTKEIKLANNVRKRKAGQNKLVQSSSPLESLKAGNAKNVRKIVTHNSVSQKLSHSSPSSNSPNLSKKSPIPNHKKSPIQSIKTLPSTAAGATKNFTCRDRVMHVLAIRPHKKPELIARLQREAISPKDRGNFAMVLQQVSSHSDNQYTLLAPLFGELQVETWPFYTESEKVIVRENILKNKKASPISPQLVSSTSKSPEENLSKRSDNQDNLPKKQKIEPNEEPSSTSISPKKSSEQISNSSPIRSVEQKSKGEESPPTVASTSDSPEYLSFYKPITTREQRFQYKRDFQLEYPEYINLKNDLDAVATKFIELDSSLKKTTKGTPEYVKIQEEIMTAYNKQLQDEKYHRMKCRCEELHQKLSHIKRLVMEYDNQMVNS